MNENELIKYTEFRKRYPSILLEVIDETIKNLSKTRKGNQIAGRLITREFEYWDKFPISKVIGGCIVYNQKKLYEKGLPEKYLRGIIRNMNEFELKKLSLFTEEELKEKDKSLYNEIVKSCKLCDGTGFICKLVDETLHTYECECLKQFNKKSNEILSVNANWLNRLGEV